MKKLILLLFIPIITFGQIIVNKETTKETRQYIADDGSTKTQVKKIRKKFNITEIQDEFIEVRLGKKYHLLSTSKHKNIKISSQSKYWNVYDGGELITMQDEIDILNFFSKYGFEYLKQNTKSSSKSRSYVSALLASFASFPIFSSSSKSSTSITFKNNNN